MPLNIDATNALQLSFLFRYVQHVNKDLMNEGISAEVQCFVVVPLAWLVELRGSG